MKIAPIGVNIVQRSFVGRSFIIIKMEYNVVSRLLNGREFSFDSTNFSHAAIRKPYRYQLLYATVLTKFDSQQNSILAGSSRYNGYR